MSLEFNRRSFLKYSAAAAVAVGAVSLITANAATGGELFSKLSIYLNGEKQDYDVELVSQDDSQLTYKIKDENGNDLEQGYVIARALDEITSMKVLSRIEGDDTKVSDELLDNLSKAIEDGLNTVSGEENTVKSISLAKLKEMKAKLVSGYTSFWS